MRSVLYRAGLRIHVILFGSRSVFSFCLDPDPKPELKPNLFNIFKRLNYGNSTMAKKTNSSLSRTMLSQLNCKYCLLISCNFSPNTLLKIQEPYRLNYSRQLKKIVTQYRQLLYKRITYIKQVRMDHMIILTS